MDGSKVKNVYVVLKNYVTERPKENDMEIQTHETMLRLDEGSEDLLVKNLYLSCDPYMRGRMRDFRGSYIEPFTPGKAIIGFGVSKVLRSSHPDFKEGDVVTGPVIPWEEYSVIKGGPSLRKITNFEIPLSYHVGILGLPGLTAYAGFFEVCTPKAGEQVFVSAAAGAVGQLVGQFAKLSGCRVVGSAGSDQKVKLLKEKLGFDDAFNYKTEPDFNLTLKRYFPEGIDIYFENVGGKMLEAVLQNMKVHARIAVCGMISTLLGDEGEGIHYLSQLIFKRIKMQGFLMTDYLHLQSEFEKKVISYLKQGKLVYIEDIVDGLENAPAAFVGMLEGKNIGKQIVRLLGPA